MNDKKHGGARSNAGRKISGSYDGPSTVRLEPAELELLDANRGTRSRPAAVRDLVRERWSDDVSARISAVQTVILHDVEQWADSMGYVAHRRLGVYPFPGGRKLWVVREDLPTGAGPTFSQPSDTDIILTWPRGETFDTYQGLVDAVLEVGGTIRWAEDSTTGRSFAGIDLPGVKELLTIETFERFALDRAVCEYGIDVKKEEWLEAARDAMAVFGQGVTP